jgi:hypothetical protein
MNRDENTNPLHLIRMKRMTCPFISIEGAGSKRLLPAEGGGGGVDVIKCEINLILMSFYF